MLAKVFDKGRYYEVSSHLELSALEKDEEATIKIMMEMLESIGSMFSWKDIIE